MSNGRSPRTQQAYTALHQKQRQRAWELALRSARENPNDHHAWLLLAALAPSPAQSIEYVERAEMLQPHDPTVRKARAWADKRVAGAAAPPAPPLKKQGNRWLRATAVFLTLLLVFALTILWALPDNSAWQALAQIEPTASPLPPTLPPPTPIGAGLGGETAVVTLPPTYDHSQPRGEPTPTLQPTATPTPTIFPTYISPQNRRLFGRPDGVAADERWINVDLSNQLLTAYEGDRPVFNTAISSGKPTHPTVTGLFRIWLRYERQTMNGYLLGYDYYLENVPYVMYFYRDYALHGAYWHTNFGVPMSHGCVNLSPDDAAWLYEWSSYGTVVYVHS
jgi:lipoprotein-anchoring transpeptidase ErfK/SrfK